MSGATDRRTAPAWPAQQGSFPGASRNAAFDAADALIVASLLTCRKRLGRPIVAGLCGAQGSGKSTTAERLRKRLDRRGAARRRSCCRSTISTAPATNASRWPATCIRSWPRAACRGRTTSASRSR